MSDNVLKTFDCNEVCPKCGDGDHSQIHFGWQVRYCTLMREVDALSISREEWLQCRCGKCGYEHRRGSQDAEV